jgi:hypothetical protein
VAPAKGISIALLKPDIVKIPNIAIFPEEVPVLL